MERWQAIADAMSERMEGGAEAAAMLEVCNYDGDLPADELQALNAHPHIRYTAVYPSPELSDL